MVANKITCADCGATLDPWEDAYMWENLYICEDCFDGKVNALSRLELADMLGSQMLTAGEVADIS